MLAWVVIIGIVTVLALADLATRTPYASRKRAERGRLAARCLIEESGADVSMVMRQYGYSCAAPDQDEFDREYQRVIKEWHAQLRSK